MATVLSTKASHLTSFSFQPEATSRLAAIPYWHTLPALRASNLVRRMRERCSRTNGRHDNSTMNVAGRLDTLGSRAASPFVFLFACSARFLPSRPRVLPYRPPLLPWSTARTLAKPPMLGLPRRGRLVYAVPYWPSPSRRAASPSPLVLISGRRNRFNLHGFLAMPRFVTR